MKTARLTGMKIERQEDLRREGNLNSRPAQRTVTEDIYKGSKSKRKKHIFFVTNIAMQCIDKPMLEQRSLCGARHD